MRTIKALPLMLAVFVAAALAGPAVASASEWTKDDSPLAGYGINPNDEWTYGGAPIEGSQEVELTSTINFDTNHGRWMTCAVDLGITLEPGSEGSLDQAAVDTGSCESSGFLEGCEVTEAAATELPQSLHAEGEAIDLAELSLRYALGGSECGTEVVTFNLDSVTLSTVHSGTINALSLFGEGTTEAFGLQWDTEAHGLVTVPSLEMEGSLEFVTAWVGATCENVQGKVMLFPESNDGVITQLTFNEGCQGSGAWNGCQFDGNAQLPWNFQAQAGDIAITGASFDWFAEACGNNHFEGGFTATPDDRYAMSSLDLDGVMTWIASGQKVEGVVVQGDFDLSPAEQYGF